MGIDGIGKGGDVPKVDPSGGSTSVAGVEGERFDLSTEGVNRSQGVGLLEQVQRRKVRVDRIIPLHGTIQPFSALEAAAKPAGQRQLLDRLGRVARDLE